MATNFSTALQMSNSTSTLFRAWAQFIDDTFLIKALWLQTADTGQMTISTATAPVAANTKVGYRVYKMNDALQATSPIFVRVDFGSGSAAATPGIWFTIGTGSNGSGTITGILFNGGASATPQVMPGANATSACDSYGSGDTNRIHFLMFVRSGANDLLIWSIERGKDSSLNDVGTSIYFGYGDGATGFGVTGVASTTPGSQPSLERPCVMLSDNSAFGSDVGVALPGYWNSILQPPGIGVIAVNSTDFSAEAPVTMSLNGTSHTFQLGNSGTNQLFLNTGSGGATARLGTRIGIRYE